MHPALDCLTATQAASDMRNMRYSAETLVAECLERISRYNPQLNALVTLNASAACEQARRIDTQRRQGERLPPLAGIPVSIKDAFATQDMRTTSGFPRLASYQPETDATVVARWRAAGAILMGKSNLSELAGAPHCWNPLFGLTHNPWSPSLTPGGSSGGAAAAVAAGFSLLEIGSDIGGSIRIPAAYCGVVGLKATENRIPRTGHIPHLPAEFSQTGRSVWHMLSFGVLARCVQDIQLGYPLLVGPDGQDSTVPPFTPPTVAIGHEDRMPAVPPPLMPPLRIALWTDFAGLPLCERTQAGLAQMVEKLEAAGHRVVKCRPPSFDVTTAWQAFGLIGGGEIGLGMPGWQRSLAMLGQHLLPKEQVIIRSMCQGMQFNPHRYNRALNQREALIAGLEAFLSDWDAVLCPVAPTAAYTGTPMPGFKAPPKLPVDGTLLSYADATVSMTIPFSVTGSPVLVLPGSIQCGVPVGVQVIGKRWQEETLLRLGQQLEVALGGFRPPPLGKIG